MVRKPKPPAGAPACYGRIREILESARASIVRSVNSTQVVANWLIGREIVEQEQQGTARANYGERLLEQLAIRLKADFGFGYGVDNLGMFRRFYHEYPELLSDGNSDALRRSSATREISDAARRKLVAVSSLENSVAAARESWKPGTLNPNLSWTHYRALLKVGRPKARAFYEIEAARNHWSARELERQINSLLFDRLLKSRDKKGLLRLATQGQEVARPIDALKDPVVLEFLDLPQSSRLVETQLEQALIGNLQHFLLELGRGFAFVSRQERISLDGDHFYIDLVFYHTVLKCFVLIDLKIGKLTHTDLGQIQFYVNYFDRERRSTGDNPTLGLILCPDKNDAVVRYTLGEQLKRNIFASRYQLHLPTEKELQDELRREMRFLNPPEAIRKPQRAKPKLGKVRKPR